MTWLVTGGAGYIGAHVAHAFVKHGLKVVVLDDLSTGRREFVPDGVPLVHASVLQRDLVVETIREHDVHGVVHLAGFKFAGVSVQRPLDCYEENVVGTVRLLMAVEMTKVPYFVFSSSASVYGTPNVPLVTEATPLHPESPYGESKVIGEWLLRDQGRATGLTQTSLRYFNVVGSGDCGVFDLSPHNLFPLVFDALLSGNRPRILGDRYPTSDGTCVRDYVHVADVAEAHVVAAERLLAGQEVAEVYNLGSGQGVSVREIMSAVARVTGVDFEPEVLPARAGDPAQIVADGSLAARDLGWKMRYDLDQMVRSAWRARQAAER